MNLVLDRVYRVCSEVRRQHQEPISFKKLVGSTRKAFKDHSVDLAIKTVKDDTLEINEFYIEAYYYEDQDFNDDPPIEVIVYHHFTKVQKFQTNQITDFLIQIYDAVVHELRHQHQFQSRDYEHYSPDTEGYAEYLADPDELDAYAFSIAIELLRNMSKQRAQRCMTRLTALARLRQGGVLVSASLHSYMNHFKHDPMLKRLAKKVYKHLETLDSNRIFK